MQSVVKIPSFANRKSAILKQLLVAGMPSPESVRRANQPHGGIVPHGNAQETRHADDSKAKRARTCVTSKTGVTRRDILRVGGSSWTAGAVAARAAAAAGAGWPSGKPRKAKSMIMIYLQGGPSHLDLWDPKENVPDNVRSVFKSIPTKIPGTHFTEVLPKLAQVNDRFSMIRSMSYTPNGLFNHTAAIYQMMTGYTTDKVSPSGQLEPPSAQGLPQLRLEHHSSASVDRADAAVRDAAAAVAGEQRGRQGRHGRLLGQGLSIHTRCIRRRRHGHEQDDNIKVDDLKLRPEVFATRLESPRETARFGQQGHAHEVDKAVESYKLERLLRQGVEPDRLRPRSRGVRLWKRRIDKPHASCTAATRSARAACSRDVWSKPARVWSKSCGPRSPTPTTTRGITTVGLSQTDEDAIGSDARRGLVGLDQRLGSTRHVG